MRIVIVDDQFALGAALGKLIAPHHEVIAVLPDWTELIPFLERNRTDLVLLDGSLPRCDIAMLVQLAEKRARIIMMTMHPNCSTWPGLRRMGVFGVVSKCLSPEEFLTELRRLATLERRPDDGEASSRIAEPSSRQLEVLLGMARGWGNKQIAKSCGIGMAHTNDLVQEVFRLTRTTSRAAAVLVAVERGWIEPRVPPPPPTSILRIPARANLTRKVLRRGAPPPSRCDRVS